MTRPTTREPATPGAAKLRALLIKKFGSVSAGARAAGLPDLTVSRYIYDPPKHPMHHVVTAFVAIGAEPSWLGATA